MEGTMPFLYLMQLLTLFIRQNRRHVAVRVHESLVDALPGFLPDLVKLSSHFVHDGRNLRFLVRG